MPKVLVIDDSLTVLSTVESVLAEAGYQVQSCDSGRRAIGLLERTAFDLILTDIYMPELDGLEILRVMRHAWPHLPVIAMSGRTGRLSMLRTAKMLGACRLLRKPFSAAELLGAVKSVLDSPGSSGTQECLAAGSARYPSPGYGE